MPHTARDLLRGEPLLVAAATPLLEIPHLLVLAQVSAMPVIDDAGHVVGLLSADDVLRAFDQVLDAEEGLAQLAKLTAVDIATPDAMWVAPDAPSAQIAARMRSAGVHRVLVGDGKQLDGVLTAFDLLAAIA